MLFEMLKCGFSFMNVVKHDQILTQTKSPSTSLLPEDIKPTFKFDIKSHIIILQGHCAKIWLCDAQFTEHANSALRPQSCVYYMYI